ncbi:MAG TPA: type II secretion system minor pseudopilin GspK [Gammaproteobacteria bacterium]|nr:type II secretion system minor pseudopilin GspK [Gammaproteobacteria bacterium]
MKSPGNRERGVAILMALVILAIAAGITSALLWDRSLSVHRSALLAAQRQAWQYDLGAEAWVEQILKRSAGKNDTLGSAWAQHLPPLPVQGGVIVGGVEDLQGRLNLNDLIGNKGTTDTTTLAALKRLLTILQINPDVANAIADWADANDNVTSPGGAESGYYASLDPPYAPANGRFYSVSTLRLVKGVTPQIYARLAPYVTALPETNTPININTAPAPVLAAIIPDFSLARAKSLVARRGKGGFQSIAQFKKELHRNIVFPLSLKSTYFLLKVTTTIGSTQLSLYSVIFRNDQGQVQSIARSLAPT